jgi:hypothetical protein
VTSDLNGKVKLALTPGTPPAISHPDMRVMYCAYGHSVATLLNPRGVSFPQVQFNSCKTGNCGSGSSFYRTLSR